MAADSTKGTKTNIFKTKKKEDSSKQKDRSYEYEEKGSITFRFAEIICQTLLRGEHMRS